MSAYSSVLGVAVLLLHFWGTNSFPTSACPVPCLCGPGPLLNCSSLGLTRTPAHIPPTAVSLNLSNNALHSLAPLTFGHVKLKGLLHLWVGRNALENLSFIWKKDRSLSNGGKKCASWAPDLQSLSSERNHLTRLPKGLGCMKSLQILQLSYNYIAEIGPAELDNCSSLKEIHLQHNSILSIHPRAFRGLKQLQVLNLSYNLLTTIPVPAYQSLQSLNALVDVSFNRWKCDCNLQTLRRWIGFHTELGDASWQVICASPSRHAGKDLLHLKDTELTCPTHEYSPPSHYYNIIVNEGTQISIPCSNGSEDIVKAQWWTPNGLVTDNQPELLIKDITEQHEGLYVCVSGVQKEHISVFDLHVYRKGSGSRPRREATLTLNEQKNMNLREATRTQSEFALAVSLSVIITFILAFILGVLLRPLLEKLWRRIRSKKQPSLPPPPTTITSSEPQQYVNEGFSDEEVQEREVRVGSRVTFGGITEVNDQVPYYVTVEDEQADGSSESNTEVEAVYETIEKKKLSITSEKQQVIEMETHRGRGDSSTSICSLQDGAVNALVINGQKLPPTSTKDMEFEPIADINIAELKRRNSSSASSNSHHELDLRGELKKPPEQTVDHPAVTISTDKTKDRILEWQTRLTEQNVDDLDPELWNDSGESFSFTEGSERSSIRDLTGNHPFRDDYDNWRLGKVESLTDKNFDLGVDDYEKPFSKEVLVDDVKNMVISSNSSESGESVGGPNKYIVNPELEEPDILDLDTFEDAAFNELMPSAGILIRQETITLEPSDMHLTFIHGESVDEGLLIDDSPKNRVNVNIPNKFGICVDVGLDTVPKVKRYVEFKESKPHYEPPSFSGSSIKKDILPEKVVTSEANTDAFSGDNRCLLQTEISADRIQKVKRYIQFNQPEPYFSTLPSSPSSTKDEAKRYSSSSEEEVVSEVMTKNDNIFSKTDTISDGVSKVKRYISFKQLDSSSPTPSESTKTDIASAKSVKLNTSPIDSSQNETIYMLFQKSERNSSSLPSSPTSTRKGLSGKTTKHKKGFDQSYYGSHENLPLYHVHPVYRTSIHRLNRGYDTDRSFSSEDEDEFIEYPRKLEITVPLETNQGSSSPNKSSDGVVNIDFDNSSSSTDVFEKKQSKGLLRLRALSARLFNRHENESDEMRSPTSLDVGRTTVVSVNKQPKLNKAKQSKNEDILFGKSLSLDHLPKVKRYLQFSHSDPYLQPQSSPLPTSGVALPEFIAKTESRKSSFPSEDVKERTEDKKIVREGDESHDGLPKVKRYISFSHTEPYSTTVPLNKQSISSVPVVQPKSRPRTSSDDDIKSTSNEDHFFQKIGVSLNTVPHVKRYIQFNETKPYIPAPTSSPISNKTSVVEVKTEAKIDGSYGDHGYMMLREVSPENIKKVKRYIDFKQSEIHSSTQSSPPSLTKKDSILETKRYSSSSDDSSQPSKEDDIFYGNYGVSKVKRYITFKEIEPYSPTLSKPSPSTKIEAEAVNSVMASTKDDVRFQEDDDTFFAKIGPSFDGVQMVKKYLRFKETEPHSQYIQSASSPPVLAFKPESERSEISSDNDVKLTAKEDHIFEPKGVSLDRVPRVKRYIQFTHPECPSPAQTATGLSSEKVKASVELRRWSTSSEEDIKPSTKDENIIVETGEYLDKIPKVKRYIEFRQAEPHSLDPSKFQTSSTIKPIKMSEMPKQSATRESTSSEDDGLGGTKSLGVPRIKRYIEFTCAESQFPVQPTAAVPSERVNTSFIAKEPRRSSNSSEDAVHEDNNFGQIGVSIPRVKRYIEFTFPESQTKTTALSAERVNASVTAKEPKRSSTSTKDDDQYNVSGQLGAFLDGVPRVKRYIEFTHPETQSLAWSTPAVSAERVEKSGVLQGSRRSSTSSEEDVTQAFEHTGDFFDKIPKVKRYIQFTKAESEPLVQTTTVPSERLGISGIIQEPRRLSTSSEDVKASTHDDNINVENYESLNKIPKVKRYIQFTQSETLQGILQFPTASTVKPIKATETEMRASSTSDEEETEQSKENVMEDYMFRPTEAHLDRVPKVKRYIQFSHLSTEQPTTDLPAEIIKVSEAVLETRSARISSEDDVALTAKVDYAGASIYKLPKVKRYIQFAHPEIQTTALPAETVNVSAKESKQPSTSIEDDVKATTSDDNVIEGTGAFLNRLPKVKRYIEFKQHEPYSPAQSQLPPLNVQSVKVTAKELRESSSSNEDEAQAATNTNKPLSTSSDNLDRIPKVKRYIEFTSAESQYPPQSSNAISAERVLSGIAQEQRISNTSSKDAKWSPTDYNIVGADIPKVKRYIQFAKSEPYSSAMSSFLSSSIVKPINTGEVQGTKKYRTLYDGKQNKQNFFQEIGVNIDKVPKVKSSIAFTKREPMTSTKLMKRDLTQTTNADQGIVWSDMSFPVKKATSRIVKTELPSPGLSYKDNFVTTDSWGSPVEQTGLNSALRKSSSLSSYKQAMGHQFMDVLPQDEPPAVPLTSPPPLDQKDAKVYLRENSEVRQRQERRRLLQQRKREMDEFNIASLNQDDILSKSPADYEGVTQLQTEQTYSSVSTKPTASSRHTEGAEAPVLRGLKTKNIPTSGSKSPVDSTTPKHNEFLI